jgi:hypothetical protein
MKKADKSSSAGTTVDSSTNAQVEQVCQPIAKPSVSGSLLLYDLMQVAAIKNEDGMPVVSYVDKPNGGSIAYLRHDAVVKRLNDMIKDSFPSVDDAMKAAVNISERVKPKLTAQEQSFFIAGFTECVKWLNCQPNDR